MKSTDEKIKVLWVETHDGRQLDVESFQDARQFKYCKINIAAWFTIDDLIDSEFVFHMELKEIKKLHLYQQAVHKLGISRVRLLYRRWYLEELSLPEGVEAFDVTHPGIKLDVLHIPQSLEHLECYNITYIPRLHDRIRNGKLKRVDILDYELR